MINRDILSMIFDSVSRDFPGSLFLSAEREFMLKVR